MQIRTSVHHLYFYMSTVAYSREVFIIAFLPYVLSVMQIQRLVTCFEEGSALQ